MTGMGKVSHVWRRVVKVRRSGVDFGACGGGRGSGRRMTESGRGQSMKLIDSILSALAIGMVSFDQNMIQASKLY